MCFYRHPDSEFGSLGPRFSPEAKRKRELSPEKPLPKPQTNDDKADQQRTNQEHFLYKRVLELEMEKRNMMSHGPRHLSTYLQAAPQAQTPLTHTLPPGTLPAPFVPSANPTPQGRLP